jgi:drug/metabolite transporter (DMT)-like permease
LQKSTTAVDGKAASLPARSTHHGLRDYLLLLALACAWSLTYPLTKLGLQSIPPVTFIVARSLVAVIFLLAVMRLRGLSLPREFSAWKLFAHQQVINSTFPFLIITWAQQYVPSANTVVLAATTPIFSFLITWGITRHEPASLLKLAGAIIGLLGTAVIIGLDAFTALGHEIVAEIAILLATLSFAVGTISGLRVSGYNPIVVAAGSLLFGGLFLLPVSLVLEHPWTLHPTAASMMAAVAMGIFSSALGLMLFYMCLTRLGTLMTNSQSYLRIPIGVALSVLLLGEAVPPNLAAGLVLVMCGVAAMTISREQVRRWLGRRAR